MLKFVRPPRRHPIKVIWTAVLFCVLFVAPAQAYTLCEKTSDLSQYKKGNKAYKRLLQGKDGWIFITEKDLKSDFALDTETASYLTQFQDALKQKGTTLMIIIVPPRGLLLGQHLPEGTAYDAAQAQKTFENYIADIQSLGIQTVSITNFDQDEAFFYKTDHHWTAQGASIMAAKLAEVVKSLPVYTDLKKTSFETVTEGAKDVYGSFRRPIKDMCGFNLPKMSVSVSKTVATDSGLLDDISEPEVVLVGTSYSDNAQTHANFEGVLKEKLSADILNVSVTGGGRDTSLLAYLNSEKFQNHPPKLLIWEMPGFYDLPDKDVFQEAIPAVYGACGDSALVKTTFDAATPVMTLFDGGELGQTDLYVSLRLADFKDRKIRAALYHQDESVRYYTFERNKRYKPDGVFFFLLPDGLSKIMLQVPEGYQGAIAADLCRAG